MHPHLYVGNRNYSSWSLRGFLLLRWADVDFDQTLIDLDQPGYGERGIADVLAVSPSGMVPALRLGDEAIWDTLGFAHYALEQPGAAALLPADPAARRAMWCVTGEMHSGFAALRRDLPMNLRARRVATGLSAETLRDVERIDRLWIDTRQRFGGGGPFLFGTRSIADAFFLPVATRFRTYAIALSPVAAAYAETLLSDAAFAEWERLAQSESTRPFTRGGIENRHPPAPAPARAG